MSASVCRACNAARLRPSHLLAVDIASRHVSTILRSRRLYSRYTLSDTACIRTQYSTAFTRASHIPQVRHQSQFAPLTPPSPESLGKPRPAKTYKRTRRFTRRALQLTALALLIGLVDTYTYDACLSRTFRTFYAGLVTALDYKINFRENPPFAESLDHVHRRSAERLFLLLRDNGGLYLKIGQAIAMQSAILPPEFQKMFASLFDDASQNTWAEVRRVIKEDFGREVEDVFDVSFEPRLAHRDGQSQPGIMEQTARASASVAQVHWARLRDGREVAIKVQKREIARQIGWDLWAFNVVTRIYSYWFDLPLYSLVPYISERLRLETDFENEVRNADKMRELVQNEPRLRDRVYIPKTYHELSSKRVMTAEWIEGVRLWDKEGITTAWHGGWRQGSPGAGGAMLSDVPIQRDPASPTPHPDDKLKPTRDGWKGASSKGGLGLSYKPVMETMVSLFSAQMFMWGVVHCDPHPGNIFIRRLPNGKPELVLIDHGLYVYLSEELRQQYALFWRSLMTFDNKTIKSITESWGINSPDLMASATLMKPYTGGDNTTSNSLRGLTRQEKNQRAYEMQMQMRKGVKHILGDGSKFPHELIFIGRNLRIVQGNNQFLGSPVNRIKITGTWASRALVENPRAGYVAQWTNYASHLKFKVVLLGSDVLFWYSRVKQLLGLGQGMDDDIEQGMKKMAKGFGIDVQHGIFEG